MKNSIFILLFISGSVVAQVKSQNTNATKTSTAKEQESKESKADELINNYDDLLIKQFTDQGTVGEGYRAVTVQTLKVTDTKGTKLINAIRVVSDEHERAGLIDVDEIDRIIENLKYFKSNILTLDPTTTNYTEARTRSRGGVEIGCFNKWGKWSIYVKPSDYSNSMGVINDTQIDTLIELLIKAKADL